MAALKGCALLLMLYLKFCIIATEEEVSCPDNLPLEIEGFCYRLYTDFNKYKEAADNCRNLDDNADIATGIRATPDKLADQIKRFLYSKVEKAAFWIGFKMEDRSMSKAKEDRDWTFDYDSTTVVEKDFELWADGEPREAGLTCAIINGSSKFNVAAVDCGGPRLPLVCMRNTKDSECKDGVKPFLYYGDYCIAAIAAALEYNKIHGACHPDTPAPIQTRSMQGLVINAALNSFIGGGVYVGVMRVAGTETYVYADGQAIPGEMWGEGEPRTEYDCAGLALQYDGSVKLRTMSCDFLASSLCRVVEYSENTFFIGWLSHSYKRAFCAGTFVYTIFQLTGMINFGEDF